MDGLKKVYGKSIESDILVDVYIPGDEMPCENLCEENYIIEGNLNSYLKLPKYAMVTQKLYFIKKTSYSTSRNRKYCFKFQ